MLVSFKHNFIFIKPKKTAGTSVEMAFSKICGPEDIVPPVGGGFDIVRAKEGLFPRNFNEDKDLEARFIAAITEGRGQAALAISLENRATGGFMYHDKAKAVKAAVPEDFWNSAFKFATERHPYEKVLSLARMRYRGAAEDTAGFSRFVDGLVRDQPRHYRGYKMYFVDGKSVMDDFILHESLNEDIARIAAKLGVSEVGHLPEARKKDRADARTASDILSDEQKAIIFRVCEPEFELFNWAR